MKIDINTIEHEQLSKLTSSEAEAIGYYSEASSKCRSESGMYRVFQDILREETRHLEILLYLDHMARGDVDYKPSDPDIIKEVEALLGGKEYNHS